MSKIQDTLLYQWLLPHCGDKASRAVCLALKWLFPTSVGTLSGGALSELTSWQHPYIIAALASVALTAVFNSIKLIVDFARAKNRDAAEITKELLDRMDNLRTEQREFYQVKEAAATLEIEKERRAKHIFVNRLHLEKLKLTAIRKGMTFEEMETAFAEQEKQLYDAETETAGADHHITKSGEFKRNE